tara:strand:- start:1470 stop:1592 length:123 start_codon:yes stop_codon:yes gene_type:complete
MLVRSGRANVFGDGVSYLSGAMEDGDADFAIRVHVRVPEL